jgi:tRNA U34 5-carboxymethylaminomethyl modifying enzyme MnmG/GidA
MLIPKTTLASRLRVRLFEAGLVLATMVSLAYAIDYLIFRYRVASNRQPFGSVTVQSYYAVGQKNGKTEYLFNPPQAQTCVHAVFSHAGYAPCWYLSRHSEQRTDI